MVPLCAWLCIGDRGKEVGALAPVGRELGERDRGEDEGWCGQRGEIA